MPGEAAELLDVLVAVGAAQKVGAHGHERGHADPFGQAGDEVGHGRLLGHTS